MLSIYSGKRVLVTGHTGFKGSWLVCWLQSLGAEVAGYSLPAEQGSHFEMLAPEIQNCYGNICDTEKLDAFFLKFKPDIVFHLAAQPLVRDSYLDPVGTYETNVLGSMKVYRAAVKAQVQVLVSITTDKVYENHEWVYGYRETDRLGGYDPYSSSKACMEIMTDSFRRSFLASGTTGADTAAHTAARMKTPVTPAMKLVTTRAGNVIGGGDWAKDRIVPDLMRSTQSGVPVAIRNPQSLRPWQHVLEPLRGYLLVGEALLSHKVIAPAYNFGPEMSEQINVGQVCTNAKGLWKEVSFQLGDPGHKVHEAGLLKLDISLAQRDLQWMPALDFATTMEWTIDWYRSYFQSKKILTRDQIKEYQKIFETKNSKL